MGTFHVLIGVNLLREGLDLPEVSLVAILDADKEGFLRNEKSLVQTVGRAARNVNGTVIMYADKMTDSMQRTIDETARRRRIQIAYNEENNQIPMALNKTIGKTLENVKIINEDKMYRQLTDEELSIAADPIASYLTQEQLITNIKITRKSMEKAAKSLDFMEAARLRDELFELEKMKK
jgi:excinuclease ABC subunit B